MFTLSVELIIVVPLLLDDVVADADVVGVLARSGVVDADDIEVGLLLLDECFDDNSFSSLLRLVFTIPTC